MTVKFEVSINQNTQILRNWSLVLRDRESSSLLILVLLFLLPNTIISVLSWFNSGIVFLQELNFRAGQIEFLKRRWVREAFEAVYTSRSRGVGILINKIIPFKLVSQHSDPYGRYLIIKCELFGELYTLLSIYRPPASDMAFLKDIQIRLDSSQTGLIIMGGDVNTYYPSCFLRRK
uniref:Endonuclease/exonuclease/phosphatase domain-containing protein n=1 Tax=Esox lucius TaxID=8010 RepID=A0A6Q2XD22_ESOLU